MVAPAFVVTLFLLVTVVLLFVIDDMKRPRPAVVHLDASLGNAREGHVTRSDKYVVVESEAHGRETFTWDQIKYISEKDLGATRFDRVIDVIDLWSKLGIAATLVFFMIGLHQYGQTQKWEREKFLANAVKELVEWKPNRAAMHMIDSLALYKTGRIVELFPFEDDSKERKVFVSNEEIFEALTPSPIEDLDETDTRAVAIRDCFDSFLSYMGAWNHYVEHGLVTKDALASHLGYWIVLLGPTGKISPVYRSRIFKYAATYGLNDFEKLIRKYNLPSQWQRLTEFFTK